MKEKMCPCGNGCMDLKITSQKTVYKGIDLDVPAEKYICPHCGMESATVSQAAKMQKCIAEHYRIKTGLLSGNDLLTLRRASGLSRDQLAALMNVSAETIVGWETCLIQNRFQDKQLRKILKGPGSYELA